MGLKKNRCVMGWSSRDVHVVKNRVGEIGRIRRIYTSVKRERQTKTLSKASSLDNVPQTVPQILQFEELKWRTA